MNKIRFYFGKRMKEYNSSQNENMSYPSEDATENFWKSIYQNQKEVDKEEELLKPYLEASTTRSNVGDNKIGQAEFDEAIRRISN